MASRPAGANNTNDIPAPTAAEVVVGLCGDGDRDRGGQRPCPVVATWLKNVIEAYSNDTWYVKSLLMLLNIRTDGKAMERVKEAVADKPMDKVDPEGEGYRSLFSVTDDRTNLMLRELAGENYELEVAVMASKFAYENMARAKKLVKDELQGTNFEFFDRPNVPLGEIETTQAMGFVRKERGRDVVYVVFRGSSEVNDWRANLDCDHIKVGRGWGNVHVGFMKALGLVGITGNFDRDFPKELTREQWQKAPAYHVLRQWLIREVERLAKEGADACPDITVRVVGHSLGGALAILFVAMLAYHRITPRISITSMEVITLGQPRVGDSTFANYMNNNFINNKSDPRSFTYKRMVYSYDPVPRVPNDDRDSDYPTYRHFGTCLYYTDWFTKQRFTDDRRMDYTSVNIIDALLYASTAYNKNAEDIKQASKRRGELQEPDSVLEDRQKTHFLAQYHKLGEYLNAARHGKESGSRRPSLVRRLLSSLLQYPTSSFWNRSRRRRRRREVIATTDDDDVSSYV